MAGGGGRRQRRGGRARRIGRATCRATGAIGRATRPATGATRPATGAIGPATGAIGRAARAIGRAARAIGRAAGPATGAIGPATGAIGPATGRATGRETIVLDDRAPAPAPGRASSTVTRDDLIVRQPRSAPDALRWEPGVYVQQTAAAQGSAYLRGRTGQQTVLLFDGIRLNNATWRQGPNQYFFTIDTRALAAIDVIRGSASTRWGSDAIGGVLDAIPRDPDPARALAPRLELRWGSADHELGGRAEASVALGHGARALVGVGYRDVSLLESGGPVGAAAGSQTGLTPSFAPDGRTQLGTGFREATWDARVVDRVGGTRVTAAYYDYRQLDAPRTDQCPPAFAPPDECLRYDEQFHRLAYVALERRLGAWAERARLTLSAQEQHERRIRERPRAAVREGGRDDVRTLGLTATATTAAARVGPLALTGDYGADLYGDGLDSVAWLELTDLGFVRYDSRGQYLTGSRYLTGGGFATATATWRALTVRAGGRLGVAAARAPGDDASATTAIDRRWLTQAGFIGATWAARDDLEVSAMLDRSFRAPNLDDLSGRQAAGPGFQFENPALAAERAITAELGVKVARGRVRAEAWAYATRVTGAIARSLRSIDDCPPSARACQGAWFRYQLVNLGGPATVRGLDGAAELDLAPVRVRATIGYAFGEGPNPEPRPVDPTVPYVATVPLSRVPPWNGTVEARAQRGRVDLALALRWAVAQDRLAPSDRGDPRIPAGGTPGYAVLDARAIVRVTTAVRIGAVVENLGDAAYRYHGSSINGPGRSVIVHLELTP
ncbi:MAG: TonB-dependent receptor [Myxococcales bacterium]|nr:TonB-dependent receptor [Myxococcales bacterium]